MRPLDVILCLALAATYHRTDAAVVATAKRLLKRVERRDRQSLFDVINHKTPCRYIIHHLVNLPDEVILNRPWFSRHSPSSGNSVSHTLLETAA
ncbi:DUF7740 domain-containing protein [Pseudomonas aeruginosa]|uniref:DUF7740 domain-containing protein n=1 Tax=Pseudomonas aeruginosa TaxID=287 RepID=UPI003D9FFE7A